MSNLKAFKYDWIWNKKLAGNGILAKRQPLKIHEIVSVFNTTTYHPQMTKGVMRAKMGLSESDITGGNSFAESYVNDEYYPVTIQEFSIAGERSERLHPTQKPVDLLRYLVLTYTNEGDTVLDNCMGSGTTSRSVGTSSALNSQRNTSTRPSGASLLNGSSCRSTSDSADLPPLSQLRQQNYIPSLIEK